MLRYAVGNTTIFSDKCGSGEKEKADLKRLTGFVQGKQFTGIKAVLSVWQMKCEKTFSVARRETG